MDSLNKLELNVLVHALERHIPYLRDCLSNPENESQFIFIKADLELSESMLARFRDKLGPFLRA